MNILLLTPTPPDHLHRIRALQILKVLAREHRVSVLTFVRHQADRDRCEAIRPYCAAVHTVPFSLPRALANCLAALPTPLPLRVAYQRSPAMQSKVDEVLRTETFDLVYVKRKRMAQYVEHRSTPARILDLTDAVSLYYQRSLKTVDWLRFPLHYEEYQKIRRYEPAVLGRFDRGVVCSSVDAAFLEHEAGGRLANLRVIPNVVDTGFYRSHSPPPSPASPTLLFSGLMDKHVNIDAARHLARDIFPAVRRSVPGVSLFIVGPRPTRAVRALGRNDGVTVSGYVDDLRESIERASVVLCPMRVGAGTRNKILQAMSMERPVVSTPLGAEGLEYAADRDLLIAPDAETFADHTTRLLRDPAASTGLAARGNELVRRRYSLDALESRLQALFSEI